MIAVVVVVAVAVGILLVALVVALVDAVLVEMETVVWLVVVGLVNMSSVGHVLAKVLVWARRVVG